MSETKKYVEQRALFAFQFNGDVKSIPKEFEHMDILSFHDTGIDIHDDTVSYVCHHSTKTVNKGDWIIKRGITFVVLPDKEFKENYKEAV